jgi:hypothetical protein
LLRVQHAKCVLSYPSKFFGDLAPVTLPPDGDSNPGTNRQLTNKSYHVTARIMSKPGQSLPLSRRQHNLRHKQPLTGIHRQLAATKKRCYLPCHCRGCIASSVLFKTKIHEDKYKPTTYCLVSEYYQQLLFWPISFSVMLVQHVTFSYRRNVLGVPPTFALSPITGRAPFSFPARTRNPVDAFLKI